MLELGFPFTNLSWILSLFVYISADFCFLYVNLSWLLIWFLCTIRFVCCSTCFSFVKTVQFVYNQSGCEAIFCLRFSCAFKTWEFVYSANVNLSVALCFRGVPLPCFEQSIHGVHSYSCCEDYWKCVLLWGKAWINVGLIAKHKQTKRKPIDSLWCELMTTVPVYWYKNLVCSLDLLVWLVCGVLFWLQRSVTNNLLIRLPLFFVSSGDVLLQAIKELNIKTKSWRELLTDEPFARDDLITIQVTLSDICF